MYKLLPGLSQTEEWSKRGLVMHCKTNSLLTVVQMFLLNYAAVRPIGLLVPTAINIGKKYILSYNYRAVFKLVSNYNTTSENIGRGNKRKDGGG